MHRVRLGQCLSKSPRLSCPSVRPTRTAVSPLTLSYVGLPEATTIKIQCANQLSSPTLDGFHPCTELHKDVESRAAQIWSLPALAARGQGMCVTFLKSFCNGALLQPSSHHFRVCHGLFQNNLVPVPGVSVLLNQLTRGRKCGIRLM